MATFFCILTHGPAWDDSRGIREQGGWDDHAAFMDGLVDDGVIIAGGPLGRGDVTAHLVEAVDQQEIRKRFADDPWAIDGHLVVGSLERWSLWLDARRTGRSTDATRGAPGRTQESLATVKSTAESSSASMR